MTTAGDHPEIDWGSVEWKKAAACGETACVEVAMTTAWIGLRDAKRPDAGPLVFTPSEWHAFVLGVRNGQFDVE
jgi:hypothetical protein